MFRYHLIVLAIISILLFGCQNERKEYAIGIINKVEIFKKLNNRLPKNVSEIGLTEKEDSPSYYKLTSDTSYEVWYGLQLGRSNTYKSETKRWEER